MKNKVLFGVQAILLIAIAAAHAYALSVDLYWYHPFVNRIIHFAGGLWVAFAALWAIAQQGRRVHFLSILGIVVLVSIGWEIFEVAIGMTNEKNYALDTALDLLMDVCGGTAGYFVAKFMLQSERNEQAVETDPS